MGVDLVTSGGYRFSQTVPFAKIRGAQKTSTVYLGCKNICKSDKTLRMKGRQCMQAPGLLTSSDVKLNPYTHIYHLILWPSSIQIFTLMG